MQFLRILCFFQIAYAQAFGDGLEVLQLGSGQSSEFNADAPAPTLFTVVNTNTGSTWKALPFREKFQWKNQDAPCKSFKLKIPDERPHFDEIEICIFRQQLDFTSDLDDFVHPIDVHYEVFEQRELGVHGYVKGVEKSVVFGRLVDKLFYGEVSFIDKQTNNWMVYEVEEISLLTKLMRHDKKMLHNLLYVMNRGEAPKVKYNAVVTQGVSLLDFMPNSRSGEGEPAERKNSFLIFSTSHNSYISSGDASMSVDEEGRLNFKAPGDSITIEQDGSVLLSTADKKYKFRPNGQTIVTKGSDIPTTLHEHEGSVAIMAFTNDMTYDCVLPPPSFRRTRKGGFLCRVCLLVDDSFQEYFQSDTFNDSSIAVLNHVIDRVSWLFRAVDWDLDETPDNIGLEYDMQVNQWNMEMKDKEFVSKEDLDVVFTKLSQMDFTDCCLAVAYTMKAFARSVFAKSSVIGLGQTMIPSGICSIRSSGFSSNVILISANRQEGNYSSLTDNQLIYLTAHEIAKAFGASSVATGKETCDQFKDENGALRHFIMWPDVLRNFTEEEKKFSQCTIRNVHTTLSGCRTACFETNQHPFCGNGLVEEGEECDCGSPFNCSKQLCCYARSGKFPCRKTGIPCSSGSMNITTSTSTNFIWAIIFCATIAFNLRKTILNINTIP